MYVRRHKEVVAYRFACIFVSNDSPEKCGCCKCAKARVKSQHM